MSFLISNLILFGLCMLSHFSCVWFFVTQWSVAALALLSVGFFRQEYWRGLPCPPLGDLPDPGIKPASPALKADSLLLGHYSVLRGKETSIIFSLLRCIETFYDPAHGLSGYILHVYMKESIFCSCWVWCTGYVIKKNSQ